MGSSVVRGKSRSLAVKKLDFRIPNSRPAFAARIEGQNPWAARVTCRFRMRLLDAAQTPADGRI
jgi:hypothetical protein